MGVTPTPNNGFPVPDIGQQNWGGYIETCWTQVDALLGKIADIGNYNATLRNNLKAIIGTTGLNTGDKTLIGAINEVLAQGGGPVTGLNDDDSNPVKLSSAANLLQAINILDGIGFRQVRLTPTTATKLTDNITGVTISATGPQIAPLTAVGLGYLRYYASTKTLTFQPYGGTEDIHINIGGGATHVLIGDDGPDDQGGIYIDAVAGSLPLTDQMDEVLISAGAVVIDDDIFDNLVYLMTDTIYPDNYYTGIYDATNFQHWGLIIAHDTPSIGQTTITTNNPAGFSGHIANVFYCRKNAQDSVTRGFLAFLAGNDAYDALFTSNAVKTGELPGATSNFKNAVVYLDAKIDDFMGQIIKQDIVVSGTSADLTVSDNIELWDDGTPLILCFDKAIVPNQTYMPGDETKYSFGGVTVSGGTTVHNSITNWGDGNSGVVTVYYCKEGANEFARSAMRGFIEGQFSYEIIVKGNALEIPIADKSLIGAIVSLAGGGGGGVTSLNLQTGAVDIIAGTDVGVTVVSPGQIEVSYSGGRMIKAQQTSAVTVTVDSFNDTLTNAAVWEYSIEDTIGNVQSGTIRACWNATTDALQFDDTTTLPVGTISGITLSVAIVANMVSFIATITAGTWTIKITRVLL